MACMMRRLLLLLLAAAVGASAGLTRLEVEERTDFADGKSYGSAGPYERIAAKAYFAIDPKLAANRIISDIG